MSTPSLNTLKGVSNCGGRVVSRINKTFKIKFSVRMLYGKATVDAISAAVDQLVEAK